MVAMVMISSVKTWSIINEFEKVINFALFVLVG